MRDFSSHSFSGFRIEIDQINLPNRCFVNVSSWTELQEQISDILDLQMNYLGLYRNEGICWTLGLSDAVAEEVLLLLERGNNV